MRINGSITTLGNLGIIQGFPFLDPFGGLGVGLASSWAAQALWPCSVGWRDRSLNTHQVSDSGTRFRV